MTQTLEYYHILDPEQISGLGLPASERAVGYPLAMEAAISLFSVHFPLVHCSSDLELRMEYPAWKVPTHTIWQ